MPEAVQDISETTNLDSNGELPVHRIYLGKDFNDRVVNPTQIQSVVDWKDWYVLPAKGIFGGESTSQGNDATGYYIEYMPYLHAEGSDEFQWTAKGQALQARQKEQFCPPVLMRPHSSPRLAGHLQAYTKTSLMISLLALLMPSCPQNPSQTEKRAFWAQLPKIGNCRPVEPKTPMRT